MQLSGMNLDKKLADLLARVQYDKDLADDIEKLIALAHYLSEGFPSDDEEGFVDRLPPELDGIYTDEDYILLAKEIEELQQSVQGKDDVVDEVRKAAYIEERVEKLEYTHEDIVRIVQAKKQRFAEMDLHAKYTRRDKEHNKLKGIVDE